LDAAAIADRESFRMFLQQVVPRAAVRVASYSLLVSSAALAFRQIGSVERHIQPSAGPPSACITPEKHVAQ